MSSKDVKIEGLDDISNLVSEEIKPYKQRCNILVNSEVRVGDVGLSVGESCLQYRKNVTGMGLSDEHNVIFAFNLDRAEEVDGVYDSINEIESKLRNEYGISGDTCYEEIKNNLSSITTLKFLNISKCFYFNKNYVEDMFFSKKFRHNWNETSYWFNAEKSELENKGMLVPYVKVNGSSASNFEDYLNFATVWPQCGMRHSFGVIEALRDRNDATSYFKGIYPHFDMFTEATFTDYHDNGFYLKLKSRLRDSLKNNYYGGYNYVIVHMELYAPYYVKNSDYVDMIRLFEFYKELDDSYERIGKIGAITRNGSGMSASYDWSLSEYEGGNVARVNVNNGVCGGSSYNYEKRYISVIVSLDDDAGSAATFKSGENFAVTPNSVTLRPLLKFLETDIISVGEFPVDGEPTSNSYSERVMFNKCVLRFVDCSYGKDLYAMLNTYHNDFMEKASKGD